MNLNDEKIIDIKELVKNREFEIIDLDNQARGIAREEGIIFFIENAILGEIVEIEILEEKKRFIEARKIRTIKESPFLKKDIIEENRLCGIFDLHNIEYNAQIDFKKNQVINTINRIADENLRDLEFVEAPLLLNYRNKIELKVSPEGYLSFFGRNTNENIKISDCIMASNEINKIIPKLQELLLKHKLKGYDASTNRGLIKNIILRSTSIGQVMGILVFNEEYDFKSFYQDLENSNIFDSFYVSLNNKRRNYKIVNLIHVFGTKKITESMGEFKFNISPRAFFQVNRDIAYEMYLKAKSYISKLKPDTIIDMYSGISTTSIILSEMAKEIISVEINKDAVKDGIENAQINDITNIKFLDEPAEKAIETIDLDTKNSVALFDPPRKGLDNIIIDKIGQSKIDNVIYISCNVATLARDIKRLKEYGYKLIEVTAYDQFVHTIEVEAVTLLSRDQRS